LADQVLDVVAQPGGNLTTDGESGDGGLTEALQNLKGETQLAMGGNTPSSHSYTKCTTLWEVRSLDLLRKWYDTLVELRPKLLEAILVHVSSVLMVTGLG
jgi:hypothetical protein